MHHTSPPHIPQYAPYIPQNDEDVEVSVENFNEGLNTTPRIAQTNAPVRKDHLYEGPLTDLHLEPGDVFEILKTCRVKRERNQSVHYDTKTKIIIYSKGFVVGWLNIAKESVRAHSIKV